MLVCLHLVQVCILDGLTLKVWKTDLVGAAAAAVPDVAAVPDAVIAVPAVPDAAAAAVAVSDTNLLVWGVDLVEEHLMCSVGIPARPPVARKPLVQVRGGYVWVGVEDGGGRLNWTQREGKGGFRGRGQEGAGGLTGLHCGCQGGGCRHWVSPVTCSSVLSVPQVVGLTNS